MAHLLLLLSAAQRGLMGATMGSGVCVGARASDPECNLLFPDDGKDGSETVSDTAWRKGKLTLGGDYWWRETGEGEPEISLSDPTDEWKVGVLEEDGREYFWRDREGSDDIEVRLARYPGEEPGEDDGEDGKGAWKVAVLPSGREYLWRESDDPDDPDVQWWTEGTLDSGEPFWYDEDGEVVLSDPFAKARRSAMEA